MSIREITEDDIPELARVLMEPEQEYWLGGTISSAGAEKSFLDAIAQNSKVLPTSHRFTVERKGKIVGTVGIWFSPPGDAEKLHLWPTDKRWGQMGRVLSSKSWGLGIGTAAGRLLIRYAFEELHLGGLMLVTLKENGRARASVEKLGFQVIGEERKQIYYALKNPSN